MFLIDCHCHAGRGDGLTGPWDTDAPLRPYLAWADEAGIQRTVLFAAFHSDYAVANRQVARLVHQQPERFYGFAFRLSEGWSFEGTQSYNIAQFIANRPGAGCGDDDWVTEFEFVVE